MFLRKHSHTLSIAFSLIITLLFPTLSHADLNLGIVSAIKNQAKGLNDKKVQGMLNMVQVGPNTVVLSPAALQQLSNQNGTTYYFNASASEIGNLKVGSIIAGSTGNGFLRKVTAINLVNGQYVVETTDTTLEEAIQNANIAINRDLTTSDINPSKSPMLKKGVSVNKGSVSGEFNVNLVDVTIVPGVIANGSLSFKTTIECNIQIDWFQLKKLEFIKTDQETANIALSSTVGTSLDKEVEVAKIYLNPIPIGPVVLVPEISVVVGGKAQIGLVASTGITQQATLTAGVRYNNGVWTPVSNFSNDFTYTPPTLSAGGEIELYAGPKLSLKVYDVVGPYVDCNGFLRLNVQLAPPNTLWSLSGGIQADAGVEMTIFSLVKLGYSIDFPELSKVIVSGGNPPVLTDNGMSPATGAFGSTFTYNLKYADADNNAPKSGHPKLHISKGGIELAGSPFTMTYSKGDYTSGVNCTYSTPLSIMGVDYTYSYEATDVVGDVAVNVNGSGPTVNLGSSEGTWQDVVKVGGTLGTLSFGTHCEGYYNASGKLLDILLPGETPPVNTDPTKNQDLLHMGLDIAVPQDGGIYPIYPIANGTVVSVITQATNATAFTAVGNAVIIKHDSGNIWSLYCHMRNVPDVSPPDTVIAGVTPLGIVGQTGGAFGDHLHFEKRRFSQLYYTGWSPQNIYGKVPAMAPKTMVDLEADLNAQWINPAPNTAPNAPASAPTGTGTGTISTSYTYSTSGTDPDSNQVKYRFDWGDGTTTDTGYVNSGTSATTTHTFTIAGTYAVKAKTIDSHSAISTNWSPALSVVIGGGGANGGGGNGNVVVDNVSLVNKDTVGHTNNIRFDIAWDNSWFTAGAPSPTANWDAAWVFAKFSRSSDGGVTWSNWSHCTLLNTGNVAPAGSQMSFGDTGGVYKGTFIYRSSAGSGSVDWNNAEIRWNYGTDAVSDTDLIQVKVFAIEMVYIPAGPFYVGDTNNDNNGCFLTSDGAYAKNKALPPYQITSENAITVGSAVNNLYYDNDNGSSNGDQSGPIPSGFPKGYNAFYIMKTEISQGQYCEFLNTLTPVQQANRISNNYGSCRNYIKLASNGKYGCDASNNAGTWGSANWALMNESNDGQWIACNYISWMDVAAYTAWSALRPFTELEFEKACRGGQPVVNDEYAWGNTTLEPFTTSLVNAGTILEAPNQGNANISSCSPYGPYRCGCYAGLGKNRTDSGASYYGVLDLIGNLWERIVTLGNPTGRGFIGTSGDGSLASTGDAANSDWPGFVTSSVSGATGSGFRGGGWGTDAILARVSVRFSAAYTYTNRINDYNGGRCARTSP